MCGIAGYFGRKIIDDFRINQTLELMKRRGPNGQKFEKKKVSSEKHCYFLHSRLSIIDADHRSDQPFHYNDKTLIFNGEIYNYLEVKQELEKIGHRFITRSDTEVLIHALDEWGTEALNKCEGMWAFALYDEKTKTLTLSRDPFGEKPLYIYEPEPGEFYFGSEIKFISSLAGVKFKPNLNHISRFLVNGYKSLYKSNETFFYGVEELKSASLLRITVSGNKHLNKYWIPEFIEQHDMSFEEAVSEVRDKLLKSVELRLNSDVPIAFHMSGGVDSNSLISIAKRVFDYDVHGFTIVNKDLRYEEQGMVEASVSELNILHTNVTCNTQNFIGNMQKLVHYHDAPVITITYYLSWLLQNEVQKNGYNVSISGTAADEIFSGYFDHQIMYFNDVKDQTNLFEISVQNWKRDIYPHVRNPKLRSFDTFIKNPFDREHSYLKNDVYSTYTKNNWKEPFSEKYYRNGLLRNRMVNEIFHETTPVILHEEDLNAMYFSIENRSPFLDRNLFSLCQAIPTKHLIKNGAAKAVLREAMRGIVSDAILDSKRKVGFNAPIFDLLDINDSNVKGYLLEDSPIFEIIRHESIEKMIEKNNLPNSDSKFLFSFLSSKMFLESFS